MRDAFDAPAVYRISVQGRIGDAFTDRLGGMEITVILIDGGGAVTTLFGELRDQAALAGVLNTLYEWHLPVLSLQRLSARPAD
jgi:hypothetical protein